MEDAWIRHLKNFFFLGVFSFFFFYFLFVICLVLFLFVLIKLKIIMISYLIEKILNYKTYSLKRKIDSLLEIDSNIYCNLGIDSTKSEKLEAKKQSKIIYRAIKKLDKPTGDRFLYYMDK